MKYTRGIKLLSISMIIILLVAGLPFVFELGSEHVGVEAAKTIIVDKNGFGNYTKIQDAINAANAGDTIRVWTGTYYEAVKVTKSVNLIGNGSAFTRVDNKGKDDTFIIRANNVNISRFHIKNSGPGFSDGISINNYQNCNISNNNFSNLLSSCIIFWYAPGNHVFNNTFHPSISGSRILVYESPNCQLKNNIMFEKGISVSGDKLKSWNSQIIENNIVNGKQIHYMKNKNGGNVPSDKGQLILANCTNLIIENLNFSQGFVGLSIGFSNNNTFRNNLFNATNSGIVISSSSNNNTVVNNTCNNTGNGISIAGSYNTVLNNTCINNKYGIYISSSNNIIKNNICLFNKIGMRVYWASSNSIINNTCNLSNDDGIYLLFSTGNTFINNKCNSNGKSGVNLQDSTSNTFENNFFNSNTVNGIYLEEDSNNNLFKDNTCNLNGHKGIWVHSKLGNKYINNICSGNKDGIFIEPSAIHFQAVNDIINNSCINNTNYGICISPSSNNKLLNNNCSHNNIGINIGDFNNNIILNNTCSWNVNIGISLYKTKNNNIKNNKCNFNNGSGIFLRTTNSNLIKNNNFTNNYEYGIEIYRSSNQNNIISNNCSNNLKNGIDLFHDCQYNIIKENECLNNEDGISLDYSSDNNTITWNNCSFNTISNGIFIKDSKYIQITNNNCSNNNIGLNMNYTYNNEIMNNTFSNNNEGIKLRSSSSNNKCHYNNIFNNSQFGCNGFSDSLLNATYNWWGDATGPYHPINNSIGFGNKVTDYVIFDSWIKKNIQKIDPKITTIDNKTALEDMTYLVIYNCTDSNIGDTVIWESSFSSGWLNWDANNKTLSGLPINTDVGTHAINVKVMLGCGKFDEHKFTITVLNTPPKILTSNLELITEEQPYYNDYNSDDDGQGTITWTLNTNATWLSLDSNTGVLSGTPGDADVGQFQVNVTVNDGNGGLDSNNFILTVSNVNDRPIIETSDVTSIYEDQFYEVVYTALEVDINDILTWTFDSNAGWLNWGQTNHTLYGTPRNEHIGNHWVRINISDGHGGYDEHYFTITVANTNDRPLIESSDLITIDEDEYYEVVYTATDVDIGDTMTWTYDSDATWLHWSPINHTLFGTPRNDHVGQYWVRIRVTDWNDGFDEHYFNLTVVNTNDRPIIETNDLTVVDEDEPYEVVYSAIDIDASDTLGWLFDSNATWLKWGKTNQTLYGTPRNSDVGSYWVKLKVSDKNGESDEHYFTLKVININDPPTITGAPSKLEITTEENYIFDLTPYVDDIDNELSELKLQTTTKYATIDGLKVIFNYPNSKTSDYVEITVSDNKDTSEPYIIRIIANLKDIDYPLVLSRSPNGIDVPIYTEISIIFSESMNAINTENAFTISPHIDGVFSWEDQKLVFKPDTDLKYDTKYKVTINPTATDINGIPLIAAYIWNFYTVKYDIYSDDDNDGYLNTWEEFLGTDPLDPAHTPIDTDSDGKPDGDGSNSQPWMDQDDDNDGYTDEDEIKANTDPLDVNDKPSTKKEDKDDPFTFLILIVVIIIVIFLLFLFVIKPKMTTRDKSKDGVITEEKPESILPPQPPPFTHQPVQPLYQQQPQNLQYPQQPSTPPGQFQHLNQYQQKPTQQQYNQNQLTDYRTR